MTAADEAQFIQLWQQGASYQAIAQALGCPLGTVASRSAALAAQGKIHPRPRGGSPSRRAQAQPDDLPARAQAPAPPPADSALPTRDPPRSPSWPCRKCANWGPTIIGTKTYAKVGTSEETRHRNKFL
jgi:DNA-binding transcriptional MocR family regulator